MSALLLALTLGVTGQLEPDEGDRMTAATATGASTFVGVVVGALGTPTIVGIATLVAFDRGATPDELLFAAVAGGAGGAALGGLAGASTTTTWTGIAVVPAAAATGALLGLVPASIFGRAVFFEGDPSQNAALSIALIGGIVLASGAAAATGAWLAEGNAPSEGSAGRHRPSSEVDGNDAQDAQDAQDMKPVMGETP